MKQILLLLAITSFSINAQIDFDAHITVDDTGGTNNPTSVYVADLDGDGDLDMISASRSDTKIAWYENTDGQGNYGPQQIISETLNDPYSVFAADLDGDGINDVLAASVTGDTVGWFKNLDGQGTFGTYLPISTLTDGPTSIYAADADGDGDMDVFSTSSGDDKVAWYENMDGQGNFGSQQIISTNFNVPVFLVSGDIDDDEDIDIISGSSDFVNGKIVWFKNIDGQGDFVEQQILSSNISRSSEAILADIDGDGDLDIAAVTLRNSGFPAAIWFENTNGQGSFSNNPILIGELNGADAIFAADFDNDNDTDIAVGSANAGIFWFKNNGSGNFDTQQVIDTDVSGTNTLLAADINNDGASDIVMAAGNADRVAWHENLNGQGSFGPANEVSAINGANAPQQIISADIDGDGDKDIIAALRYGNRVVWQENLDGQGTFSEIKTIANTRAPWGVFPGDVDGDGFVDIIIASQGDQLTWHKNMDGQGNFGGGQLIFDNTLYYPEAVYATDIDNDGDLDVFSYENTNFFWQENLDGQGNFGNAQIISNDLLFTDSFTSADIDGDGDKDIIACYYGDGTVAWFENLDGQGDFGTANIIDTLISADSVDVADFDNDGDIDMVTLDYVTDEVMWYENTDGQGTFGNAIIISTTISGPFSLYAKDFNNDGAIDVVCTAYSSGEIIWLQNDGNGNFNYQQTISSNVKSPISVFADDYNNDGKMDILTCSLSQDEIIWFENKGPLGIEENTTNLFSIYPNPNNGLLNIKSAIPISEITIYNNLGQLLFTSEENNQIDISTLSEGIYFVKIKDENGQTETKKVLKK